MKKILLVVLLLSGSVGMMSAQDESKMNVGFGMGLDYGGFGGRFTFIPVKQLGLFAGLGFNLDGLGYNIGGQFRIPTEGKLDWYFTGMYGYNGVVLVSSSYSFGSDFSKTYYGFSIGAGMELKLGRSNKQFLNFELIVPFRDSEFKDTADFYDATYFPVAFSIGYHIRLGQ